MMNQRLILILLGCTVLGFACDRRPTVPPKKADATEPAGQAEPLYLGKPVEHWTGQTLRLDGPEDLDKTVEALALALKDERANVRVAAADALGRLGSKAKAAAPALIAASEERGWVVSSLIRALQEIGAAATPALIDALGGDSARLRWVAINVLGDIGADAREAIPALEKAAEDESLHDLAMGALRKIRGEVEPPDETTKPATRLDARAAGEVLPLPPGQAGDWPRFRGPRNDGICRETGLLHEWPTQGPRLLWKMQGLGRGFSTVSIADGKIFTMGDRKPQDGQEAQFVLAFDLTSRKELWATRVGPPHRAADGGPRCTPTVDGKLLYAIGTDGDLVCAETDTGKVRWRKNLVKDFGGEMMSIWKYSESPLIDGDKLICTPGARDAAMVALDKRSGNLTWKSALPDIGENGKDGAGYSSAVAPEINGMRQVVQMLGRGVVGVEAETGRFLWGYNRIANKTANVTAPIVCGDHVFVTASYQTGSALLKITRDGGAFKAEEVYFLGPREFENMHGGVVLVGGYIYGGHGSNGGSPTCIEAATGKIVWQVKAPAPGSAAVLYADGHLIFRYDRGLVTLVEATPKAFRLKATFQPPTGDGPAWSHPIIYDGRLYLRHGDMLLCYDLRPQGGVPHELQ